MNRRIEVIISPRGETRLETKGFAGPSCQQASRAFEEALGCETAQERTAEYYAANSAVENVTEKRRQ